MAGYRLNDHLDDVAARSGTRGCGRSPPARASPGFGAHAARAGIDRAALDDGSVEACPFFVLAMLAGQGSSYLFIKIDSIRVGYGSRVSLNDRFEHVSEKVPENDGAVKPACLVRGESVHQLIRDVV